MNRQIHERILQHRLPKTRYHLLFSKSPSHRLLKCLLLYTSSVSALLPQHSVLVPWVEEPLVWSAMAAVTFFCASLALLLCVVSVSAAFTQCVFHQRKRKEYSKTPNSCPFKWKKQHKIASGPLSHSVVVLHHKHLVIARLYQMPLLFSAPWFYTVF